jgi:hypothetical protein
MELASMLFEKGIMSSGQAADMAGFTKREFSEQVGHHGVSVLNERPRNCGRLRAREHGHCRCELAVHPSPPPTIFAA